VAIAVAEDMQCVVGKLQSAADQLAEWSKDADMVLNAAKTKVMIFGNSDEEVKITIEGSVVEKVNSYKYLGVILDVNLDFGLHVEHAVAKARRASAKVSSLIDGRNGLPVHIGIDLYKVLVRPHLEYALPVWASICDEDLRKLEDLQLQCIKRVLGTKAHSSSAIGVISSVIPFGIRKRELCCREYIRIISEGHNHPLMQLFNCTTRVGLKFCPMEYIRIMSRQLQRQLQGCVFQSVQRSHSVQVKMSRSNNSCRYL